MFNTGAGVATGVSEHCKPALQPEGGENAEFAAHCQGTPRDWEVRRADSRGANGSGHQGPRHTNSLGNFQERSLKCLEGYRTGSPAD